jgi:hypothetical protein
VKIRTGFVSNSSSSSFVIATDKSIVDVAFAMVPAREWGDRDAILQEKLLTLSCCGKIYDPNTPLAFKSCNFNTFMMKFEGLIFVESCNNHPWYDFVDYRMATDEDLVLIGQSDRDFDYFKLQNLGYYFYWPEFDLYGTSLYPDYKFCNVCFCDFVKLRSGEIICPNCKTGDKRED